MPLIYGITGVASGIGAELAKILMGQGHEIVGFDIVEPEAKLANFIKLDLSDPDQIDAAVSQVNHSLDGLCNNAGLPPRDGLTQEILQVNFLSQRLFTMALIPRLKRGGSIVNMASRAGHRWQNSLEQCKRFAAIETRQQLIEFIQTEEVDPVRAYDLSKEAMILWTIAETEAMFGRGLRVNSVSPGAIATRILDDFAAAFGDRMAKNVARTGRHGNPREVAEVAAFLLSSKSSWINGTDIAIDGGMGGFNLCDQIGLDVLRK
jgi:NAD(P)-dependent dehydrogenase (short-subunit alcohol dehydrogenase family)